MAKRRSSRLANKTSPLSSECSFVLFESASNTAKITATDENLLIVHKIIHLHLIGRKMLSKFKIRKLHHILNRMHCPSHKEKKCLKLAQAMLSKISKQLVEADSQDTEICCSGNTVQDNIKQMNITGGNTTSFPSNPSQAKNQSIEKLLDESFNSETNVIDLTQDFLTEQKENVLFNTSSNVIKLRLNAQESNVDSLSFPLELLTNTNFLDTPRTTNAGFIEQYSQDTIALSDITNLEMDDQNLNKASTNESIFKNTEHRHLNDFSHNVENTTINRNMCFDNICVSSSPAMSLTTENISTSSNNMVNSSEEIIWKKPKTITPRVTKTYNSFIMSLKKDVQSQTSDYEIPSEGSIWKEGNVKISQASEYDYNDYIFPEIISIDTDTPNVDNIVIETIEDETENELSQLTEDSSMEISQSTREDKRETKKNGVDRQETESLVFNLETTWNNCNSVRVATDFIDYEENQNQPRNSLKQPGIVPLSQESVIDETPEMIIDETEYGNSGSSVLKKYNVPTLYNNSAQSNSFLNYGKSKKKCSFERRQSEHSGENGISESTEQIAQTENILLNNGAIPKKQENIPHTTSMATDEDTDSDRIKALEEKIMKRRKKYEARWKDMPLNEKVSAKFIDEFHVNVFEEPVEALLDINYKPNFDRFYFPRLTKKEMYEKVKPTWEKMKIMNGALTKVITDMIEKSNTSSTFSSSGKSTNDSDTSNSSDEENASNKRWLKNYFRNMEHDKKGFMEETFKERQKFERLKSEKQSYEHQDKDMELAKLIKKFSDVEWLDE